MDWDKVLEHIVEKSDRDHASARPLVDEDNLKSFRPLEGLRQGVVIEIGYVSEEKKNWGRAILTLITVVLFACVAFILLLVPVIFPIMDALGIDVK